MPGIRKTLKRTTDAIANLKTVSKLISSSKYYGYLNRIYAADSGKRGDKKIQDINDEINLIKSVQVPKGIIVTNQVLKENIKEGKKFKSPKPKTPRKKSVKKELKPLHEFVVNVLKTYVFPPFNGWMNMRYFEYGKREGRWSDKNIQSQKKAEEDNINTQINKTYWKKGEKIVYVVQESVRKQTEHIVNDGENNFLMTTKGIKSYVLKNQKQDVIKYNGKKPYQYNKFSVFKGIIKDDYSTTKKEGYNEIYLSLPQFLNNVINQIYEKYEVFTVIEAIKIIKVNDGIPGVGTSIYSLMQNKIILKDSWLRYAKDISPKSFEETENICVYHQLSHFLLNPTSGRPTKFLDGKRVTKEAIYEFLIKSFPDLKMTDGVSTHMINLIGKETKRNVYAYDFNDKCFFKEDKNTTDRNYCPIVFYRGNGHMYLIDSKEATKSITERNKSNSNSCVNSSSSSESTTVKKKEVFFSKKFDGILCDGEEVVNLEKGVYLLNRYSICNDVIKFIEIYKSIPRVYCRDGAIVSMSFLNSNNDEVCIACDVNYEKGNIMYEHLKNVADANKIEYVNEGIGAVVSRIICKDKKQKREYLDDKSRLDLINSFHNKCTMCGLESEIFEIDHITPLSSGGTNEIENLQPLCPDCHRLKTESERENGEYNDEEDVNELREASNFNQNVFQNVISSDSFKTFQFVERLNDDAELNEKTIKKIDMNKCRKNLLYYSKYEFPVFSVMDSVVEFNPTDEVKVGYYYVETENIFPFRGCGWYSHPIVELGLKDQLIEKIDIKFKLESSKQLPKDHFQKHIDKLLESFSCEPILQKLCVNTFIGLMGKIKHTKCDTRFTLCKYEAADLLCNPGTFIVNHIINEEQTTLYQSKRKQNVILDSTMYPIFIQILHMEAMHLYETEKLVKSLGGVILDRNTDAIRYIENLPLNITEYFWDDAKTVLKYKWENPKALMTETKPRMKREPVEGLSQMFTLKWEIEYDYETHAKTKAIEIVDNRKSLHLDGRAGTGKSFLTNQIIEVIKERNLNFVAFSPTNKGARIINGVTIDSMYYALKKNKSALNKFKKIDVVIVDEVSMMQERFYNLFITIKKISPETMFIIAGDFEQLPPVKDSWVGDYKNSPALFELCDGNRLQLTKNRRSDSRLFDLARDVETTDIKQFPVKEKTYLNLAFKHTTRKRVNQDCLLRYLQEEADTDGTKLVIPADPKNPKTQDVILTTGIPVVCHTTRNNKQEKNKGNGFLNSERFKVSNVYGNIITLRAENRDGEIQIKTSEFHKYFYIGFCITVHTSQGETFSEKYTIHDWNFFHFCKKAKYVAVSRATSFENIQIAQ